MPKSNEQINQDLDDLLTSKGYDTVSLDSSGKEVPVPDEAALMQFHFHRGGKDYGTVTATIDGLQKLTVYYDDEVANSGTGDSSTLDEDRGIDGTSWISLVKQLKKFSKRHQLGFVLKNSERLRKDMKRRRYKDELKESKMIEQTKLDEGYYGNRKMSYNDVIPEVKIVIKHNRQLEETDQRFRHIERIFLETSDGERFAVPTDKPSRARMFARHIAEGGAYRDDRWGHLNEICEDLDKLGGFVRATHTKREQFNESAQRMINEAQEQYGQLRETVKKLSGSKGYNKYFESYEPRVILEDDTDLSEAFMNSSIDARIESALPTLSKFGIKMGKINEAEQFSNWANDLVDESLGLNEPNDEGQLLDLFNNEIPFGPNAQIVIAELDDIIEDDELYDRLRRGAANNPNGDARSQIVAWMQEQDTEQYRQILSKISTDFEDADAESGDAEAEPAPAEPQATQEPQKSKDDGLPPISEGDDQLSYIKRLIGSRS